MRRATKALSAERSARWKSEGDRPGGKDSEKKRCWCDGDGGSGDDRDDGDDDIGNEHASVLLGQSRIR